MQLPEQVKFIISELNKNGYEGYIVGGCVRDYLMGIPPHDYDITTSALPEEVKAIFPHTVDTGIRTWYPVTVIIDKIGYELLLPTELTENTRTTDTLNKLFLQINLLVI